MKSKMDLLLKGTLLALLLGLFSIALLAQHNHEGKKEGMINVEPARPDWSAGSAAGQCSKNSKGGLTMSKRKLENPSDESLGSVDVSELIAARAHEIFQARGGEDGHYLDDWLQAEQEVRASPSEADLLSPDTKS